MEERFETFTVLIAKINRSIKKIKIQEMGKYGLRSPHVSCLYHLYSSEGLTATDLSERCEEDKATISRSIDFLEKNDYIVCISNSAKRYKSPLSLTEKGSIVGKKIADKIARVLDDVSIGLTDNERDEFYKSLAIISKNLDNIANSID